MYTYGITGTSIDEFRDVTLAAISNGEVLVYDSTTSQWVNVDPSTLSIALDNLSDVTIISLADDELLQYDSATGLWKNTDLASLGISIGDITDITADAAEINILDGATVSTAELNVLDGITADVTELNILDGVTTSTAELNYVDGVTSNIQTQIDDTNHDLGLRAYAFNFVPHQISTSGRYHTVQNVAMIGNNTAAPGACTPIMFDNPTTVEKIAMYTFVPYTGATATYRLGIYENDAAAINLVFTPGVLKADAGTLTLANPTAVGVHELTFASPVSLSANTLYWMVCAHTNTTVPFTAQCSGNIAPAGSGGLQLTANFFSSGGVGYRYSAAGGTALVDPFVVDATFRTTNITPLVYLKIA